MRVCHLTTVHQPFDTRIFHKECCSLALAGHDVSIVVPHALDESARGVRILAVKRPQSRRERMFVTPCRVLRRALAQRADLYHFHDPELMPAGLILRALGRRVIYDAHEDSPAQAMSKHYLPRPVRRVVSLGLRSLEFVTKYTVNGVIAATPAISRKFPRRKTVCVQNFPALAETAPVPPAQYVSRPPHVVFTGWVRKPRGILEVLQALPNVAELIPDVRLILLGGFSPAGLEAEARAMAGWKFVDFHSWVSREEMLGFLSRARVGIVTFHPDENHINAQPNKLFEYMASALPVVASDFPLWREIVAGHQCGEVVDPMNPSAIAAALTRLLADPGAAQVAGENGRNAVERQYTWEAESRKLMSFYGRFLPGEISSKLPSAGRGV